MEPVKQRHYVSGMQSVTSDDRMACVAALQRGVAELGKICGIPAVGSLALAARLGAVVLNSLGPAVAAVVAPDLRSLGERLATYPAGRPLNELLQSAGPSFREDVLWATRETDFVRKLLYDLITNELTGCPDRLTTILNDAYSNTLAPYHSWITKQVFHGMAGCGFRRKEWAALLESAGDINILSCIQSFCDSLNSLVLAVDQVIQEFNMPSVIPDHAVNDDSTDSED